MPLANAHEYPLWINERRAPWTLEGERTDPITIHHEFRRGVRDLTVRTAIAGAVIFAAGYTLSQTGDALAEQTGIGSGMVGFALIGVATSLPELSSIVAAFRIRRYEMAFGQVLGPNYINLSLVLAADGFFPDGAVIGELGRFEIVSALLGAMLTGVFMVGLLEHRRAKVVRMGYDSLIVIVLFVCGLVLSAIR